MQRFAGWVCGSEPTVRPPSQLQGGGLKSTTEGVTYTTGISKCYNLRAFFFPSESLVVKHLTAYNWLDIGQSKWKVKLIAAEVAKTH